MSPEAIINKERYGSSKNNYVSAKNLSPVFYKQLCTLGLIPLKTDNLRAYNVGDSNYATKVIQPWSIWLDYPELTSWDHDIIKRTLRTKSSDSRIQDYQKIIHICNERIRQLNTKETNGI